MPVVLELQHRLEGLEVAEVVAGEEEPAGVEAPRPACSTTMPLCIPWERISITCRPGSRTRPYRSASSPHQLRTSRSKAASGSRAAGCARRAARPLSST